MKLFKKNGCYYEEYNDGYNGPYPWEVGALVGRILAKLALFGAGFVLGQVVRGVLRALGFVLPSLF